MTRLLASFATRRTAAKLIVALLLVLGIGGVASAQVQLGGHVFVPSSTDSSLGQASVVFTSDANCTLVPATNCTVSGGMGGAYTGTLVVTGTISATRQLIVPLSPGRAYTVENKTTGGQNIQLIGATGGGITVPNGTIVTVVSDGANYLTPAGGFLSGTLYGQNVCWHTTQTAPSTPAYQAACLTYAGHGVFYGAYSTVDGSTFIPAAFTVGQLQVTSGNDTSGNGIIFWSGDTATSGTNLLSINGYATSPTGACPHIAGMFVNPEWAFGADESVSYCSNAASSTWQVVLSGGVSLGVVRTAPTASQTITQPSGTSFSVLESGAGGLTLEGGSIGAVLTSTGTTSVTGSTGVQVLAQGTGVMSFPNINTASTVGVLEGSTPATDCVQIAADGVGLSSTGAPCGGTSYFIGTPTVTVTGAPTGSGQQLVSTSTSGAGWLTPSTGIRPFDTCNSFGDSTTYGLDAVSRYASYPSVVSTHINVNCLNQGVSGITSNGVDAVLLAATLPATVKGLNTYMIGTNNVTGGGSDANQLADFSTNVLAQYAFLAIPPASRISASTFTYSGSWSTGTYTSSRKSTTSGNTATFSVTGTTILLATTLQATFTNGGTATLTCDGTPTGVTLQFAGSGSANIVAGSQTGLNVVTGLTNTTHSCVVAVTSSSPGIVDVVWAAGLSGASQSTFPHEIAISLFDRNPTDANTPNYRAAEAAAVTQLQGYGLSNLQYVSEAGVLTAPSNYNDTLHPSEYGYYLGAQPVIADIDALAIVTPTLPNQVYYGAFLTNNTQASGGQNLFFGFGNGLNLTTAQFDVVGGFGAGEALTSGGNNTLLGWSAASLATTSAGVTGIGADVFQNLTTGSNNTCAGTQSGKLLTTGGNNTCIGFGALDAATTAAANTAVGFGSLSSMTTGPNNVGIGSGAGQSNNVAANVVTIGVNDIMIGTNTGQSVPSATATTGAIAIGPAALFGGSGTVEMGQGTCATANTFCYQGFQFLTSTGVASFATGSTVNSSVITTTAGLLTPPPIGTTTPNTVKGTTITGTTLTDGTASLNAGSLSGAVNGTFNGTATASTTSAATSAANFNSGVFQTQGSYWTGSAAANDDWTVTDVMGTGANPSSTLTFAHTGSSGSAFVNIPNIIASTVSTTTFTSGTINTNTYTGNVSVPPVLTPGTAAGSGSGATAVCATGHQCDTVSGEVTLTTGTTVVTGTLLTIGLGVGRAHSPNCVVSLLTATGLDTTMTWVEASGSSANIVLTQNTTPLVLSTAYQVNYTCFGN